MSNVQNLAAQPAIFKIPLPVSIMVVRLSDITLDMTGSVLGPYGPKWMDTSAKELALLAFTAAETNFKQGFSPYYTGV